MVTVKWSCLANWGYWLHVSREIYQRVFIRFFGFELTSFCCGRNYIKNDYSIKDGHTTFVQGDKIGFFACPKEIMLFRGHWVRVSGSRILLCFGRTRRMIMIFSAFYPYAEGAQRANVPMPDLSEQDGTLENIGKWDFLVANKTLQLSDQFW